MLTCYFCHSKNITQLLDLGLQPISNRFLKTQGEREETYDLVMNQCQDCGLVQVNDPASVKQLQPPYDWITYGEPEEHLDRLVEIIKALPGITADSSFCGISFKDDTTLTRLRNLGFSKTHRLDLKDDLDIDHKGAGVETVQAHLTPERALAITDKLGKFDVVILRHIFEHVHDLEGFTVALKNLTREGGYIVFEVPDNKTNLETYDYTLIWEEHTFYFTPATFLSSLGYAGFKLERYEYYPYPLISSLVGIVHAHGTTEAPRPSPKILDEEIKRAERFASYLPRLSKDLQKFFGEHRKNHGKIALLGAGHLACTFVSVLGLKDHVDFFVDDNKDKQGLFMPGCRLPIYGSEALRREGVGLCILSFNPSHPLAEKKVLQKHQDWKGTFASIVPSSPLSLHILLGSQNEKVNYAA